MTYLSEVFKYISYYRRSGHQIGRKIGDMLEIITYGALDYDYELSSRLIIEPKLYGFSDAGHKVEFVISKSQSIDQSGNILICKGGEITDPSKILGFIECKKVGVEQTINGQFKKKFKKDILTGSYKIPYGETFKVNFNPRDSKIKHSFLIKIDREKINIVDEHQKKLFEEIIQDGHRIIFTLSNENESKILGNTESLRTFRKQLKNCKILEIQSRQDDHCLALLNDCLTGPQTPEKAKQASFVALDVRKRRFNSFDLRPLESDLISVLVLTEFSHWEIKSQKMIKACIDKNFIISDELIIKAFEAF